MVRRREHSFEEHVWKVVLQKSHYWQRYFFSLPLVLDLKNLIIIILSSHALSPSNILCLLLVSPFVVVR